MRPDYSRIEAARASSAVTSAGFALLLTRFHHLVDGPGHAGGDTEDVAPRPWGERAPVIEASDARGHQTIEQVLLGEFRRLLIVDLLMTKISDHDDALTVSSPTLTYRRGPDSDRHRMSFAGCRPRLYLFRRAAESVDPDASAGAPADLGSIGAQSVRPDITQS